MERLDGNVTVVGEVGLSHDGSLGMAHAYVDAIARAGADAIKFQTHLGWAESSELERWRKRFSPQDETRLEYWDRTAFTEQQWQGLRDHAVAEGLLFLSTPFSVEAVDMLQGIGVHAWKIASGEISNDLLLDRVGQTDTPVWLSTGMSPWSEIDHAVALLKRMGSEYAVFQCTSEYPCPPEDLLLRAIPEIAARYQCRVGLSDHSGTIYSPLAAVTLGATIIETHVVLTHEQFGPDVSSSITTSELATVVKGVRFIRAALDSDRTKDELAEVVAPMRKLFMKSLAAARTLEIGTVLRREDLLARKPGDGIPASSLARLVGKRTIRTVESGAFLSFSDFESIQGTDQGL